MNVTTVSVRSRLACHLTLLVCVTLTPTISVAENGCTSSTVWSDYRGDTVVNIASGSQSDPYRYRPRCTKVVAGTSIHFTAADGFGTHPLFAGTIENGQPVMDETSPIGSILLGTEATRVLPEAGEYPYFCDAHFQMGMQGSILVVPQLIFVDGFDGI